MNSKILTLLEFNKILDLLRDQAGSGLAKERIAQLEPMTNMRMAKDALTETTEAVSVILRKGTIPLGGLYDVKKKVRYAEKGGVLTMKELLEVMHSLRAARQVLAFLDDGALDDIPMSHTPSIVLWIPAPEPVC